MILVLGGDGPPRAERAAQLYRERVAPLVLVTGSGDCLSIRALMAEAGVPMRAIEVECASRSTWENAKLSAPLLRKLDARSVVLVTSWFHTRRALGCFQLELPGIRWMSAPVGSPTPILGYGSQNDRGAVLQEYLKLTLYILLGRIDFVDAGIP